MEDFEENLMEAKVCSKEEEISEISLRPKTLKEYIQKGFVLNDEMMKNGRPFGKDYFDELLESKI